MVWNGVVRVATGSRRVFAGAVVAALLALPVLAPPAAGATGEVGLVREAWFQAPVAAEVEPLCAAPTGCSPTRPSGYPEDTLHVGNLNGSTSELATITFDRSVVPATAELVGGTAVLPVADAVAGTLAADTAAIVACLVVEPFEEVDGAPASEAPAHDCTVRSVATYDAEASPARFVVDLSPFVAAWEDGRGQGIALVPDSADTGSWHVAFSGRERSGEGTTPPPSAQLVWQPASEATDTDVDGSSDTVPPATPIDPAPAPPPAAPAPTSGEGQAPSFGQDTAPVPNDPVDAQPPAVAPAPEQGAPADAVAAPAPDTTALPVTPASVPIGYAYRWGWVLPLLVLLAGTSLTRSLATEVQVVPAAAPRGLGGRLWLAIWDRDEG